MLHVDAPGPSGLLGLFGRPYLLRRRPELAVQDLIGGPIVVYSLLSFVEVLDGPFEKAASALHLVPRGDGIGGETRRGLVEVLGETGGLGVRDLGLDPIFRPLVEQRTLGLQVAGDEPFLLVELVQLSGEFGELLLRGPAFFLNASLVTASSSKQQHNSCYRRHEEEE